MAEENQPSTIWKGKGPIVYSFSIEKPEKYPGHPDTPSWHSNTLGDAWTYRLSIAGAPGPYENSVPDIFFLADTKLGVVRDMAEYIYLGMHDKQFFNLPPINLDTIEITDNTGDAFKDLSINAIFANASRIADSTPPPGEPAYIIEITKNNDEPQDKQYAVNIIYTSGFNDHRGLTDSEKTLHEGTDKFSKISAAQVPEAVARYIFTIARRNDIKPSPSNMKIINFTDNPAFTVQQIFATIGAIIPQYQQSRPPVPAYGQYPNAIPTQPTTAQGPYGIPAPPIARATQALPSSRPAIAEKKQEESPQQASPELTEKPQPKQSRAKSTTRKKGKLSRFYKPKYDFKSVIGLSYAKKFFHDNVILGLERPDLFARYKKSIHDGFLLYGPPGIGKTYIVGALAKEAKMKLLVASVHQLLNMYLGNTEKNIHEIFEQARKNAPCIILFDEIDGLGMSRGITREGGHTSSALALNQLLTEMDGIESENENVIVIGATNAPQDVDPALLRSGRFTNTLYMRPPNKEDRTKLFEFYADDIPKEHLDYEKLGEESNNLSPADISAVVKAAVTPLIAEAAKGGEAKKLTDDDLLTAIRSRRASGSSMIKWYEDMDKILRRGGFSEDDKLRYSEMLEDIKKRVKAPRTRRKKSMTNDIEVMPAKRLKS